MNSAEVAAIVDGERAEAALEYLAPIFEALRSKATDLLMQSGLDQVALREKLFLSIRAFNHAEGAIKAVIQSGLDARVMADFSLQAEAQNALAEQGLTRP